jgi:AAA+ ATPase superfamily predicted ATPase
LPFRFTSIGRWWDRAQEIDIVAYNPQGAYLICECKWRNQRTGMRDLLKLQEKTMTLQANETYFMFFSKSGFTSELLEYASKHDHITLVSEDEPQG